MNKKKFKTGWKRIPRDEHGNLIRLKSKEGEGKTGDAEKKDTA